MHRKTRLVLLVSRADERSVELGRALAALYAVRLPESRASMARARDDNDVLRLVASRQLDVAILREERCAGADAAGFRAVVVTAGAVLLDRCQLRLRGRCLRSGWRLGPWRGREYCGQRNENDECD